MRTKLANARRHIHIYAKCRFLTTIHFAASIEAINIIIDIENIIRFDAIVYFGETSDDGDHLSFSSHSDRFENLYPNNNDWKFPHLGIGIHFGAVDVYCRQYVLIKIEFDFVHLIIKLTQWITSNEMRLALGCFSSSLKFLSCVNRQTNSLHMAIEWRRGELPSALNSAPSKSSVVYFQFQRI